MSAGYRFDSWLFDRSISSYLLIVFTGIGLIIGLTAYSGVIKSSPTLHVEEIDGHEYIIYHGYKQGGVVHSESCPCRTAK